MSAGRKIETFLTFVQAGSMFRVTKHAVVSDLHPTKGWRVVHRDKEHQIRDRAPSKAELVAETVTVFERRAA